MHFCHGGSLFLLCIFLASATLSLSYEGRNPEVEALIAIRNYLNDPNGVLRNWDVDSVDPCSWAMITCSSDNLVIAFIAPSQGLSGTLSGLNANLTNLKQMRLNNNSLSGAIPLSLARASKLAFLDLSYNNFSGPVPKFPARTFNVVGNPLICGSLSSGMCNGSFNPIPLSFFLNTSTGKKCSKRLAIALAISCSFVSLFLLGFGFIFWKRSKQTKQSILNVNDLQDEELIKLGNLRSFAFKELQHATDNFSSKNILGTGGFGNVYRGKLGDGSVVAVKRLKDISGTAGESQFQTELELISLAVHRNLLRLVGYCATPTERLLVYPYMSNGSVAARLRGMRALELGKAVNQKGAALEWVNKMQQEKKIDALVDRELGINYDRIEVGEMLQVAILCTQYLPAQRPKMSEVVRMLEGDGLAEKWAASHNCNSIKAPNRSTPMVPGYDENEHDHLPIFGTMTDDDYDAHAMELSGPR
nr:probable LRR receptor-like serine/threonine-protein kinase At2g23950 [Ipomoea trifida]